MWTLPVTQIEQLLAEDAPAGDLTSDIMGIRERRGRMRFWARQEMVLAGVEIAGQMLSACGCDVTLRSKSGKTVSADAPLLEAMGPAGGLHTAWKTAQTLIEVLSGLASAAQAIVRVFESVNPQVRVACTRKTFPGARRLSQIAVRAGGAILHRHGLSETVLVFPEHRAFCGAEPLAEMMARMRGAAPEKKLVIEVGTVAQAKEAIDLGFDAVQLEKFAPSDVEAVARHARAARTVTLVIAAGGINPDNAAAFVRAGAGLIVTSWP